MITNNMAYNIYWIIDINSLIALNLLVRYGEINNGNTCLAYYTNISDTTKSRKWYEGTELIISLNMICEWELNPGCWNL